MKFRVISGGLLCIVFLNAFAAPSPKTQGKLTQIYTSYGGYATFASNNYLIGIDEVAPDPKEKCSAGDLSLRVMDQKTGKKVFENIPVGSENTVWDFDPKLFNDESSDTVYVSALYFNSTADCDHVVPQIFGIDFNHHSGVEPKVTRYIAKESYFEAAALPSEVAVDGEGTPSYIVDQYTADKQYAVNWICTIKVAKQTTECMEIPVYPSYYKLPPRTGFQLAAPFDRLKTTQQTIKDQHQKIWEELSPAKNDPPEVKMEKLEALKMASPFKVYSQLLRSLPKEFSHPVAPDDADTLYLHSIGFDYDETTDQFILSGQGSYYEPFLLGISARTRIVEWVEALNQLGFSVVRSSDVHEGIVRASNTGFPFSHIGLFNLMERTWQVNVKDTYPVTVPGYPIATAGGTDKYGAVTYYQTFYDFNTLYSPPYDNEVLSVGVYTESVGQVNLNNREYVGGHRNIILPTLSRKTWITSMASDDENQNLFAHAMNFDYNSEAPVPDSLQVYDWAGELLAEARLPNTTDKASGYIFNYYTTNTLVVNGTNGTEVFAYYFTPTRGNCSDTSKPCQLTPVGVKFLFETSP